MKYTITTIFVLLYDLVLIAGTAFLVQEYNWSMWTFLLTGLFCMKTKNEKDSAP